MKTILLKGIITSLAVPLVVYLILRGFQLYTDTKNNEQKDGLYIQIHGTEIQIHGTETKTVYYTWFKFGLLDFITMSITTFICFFIIVYAIKLIRRFVIELKIGERYKRR